MSDGGITVTKTTTGSHYLEDIKINVHHQHPTFIPADQVLSSTDLHRALSSKILFKLMDNTTHLPKPQEDKVGLQEENRVLREVLALREQQLQGSVDALTAQIKTLASAISDMRQAGPVTVVQTAASHSNPASVAGVVGGEVPMFIPEVDVSAAKVRLQVSEQTSEGSSVAEAANRLKQLRKEKSG